MIESSVLLESEVQNKWEGNEMRFSIGAKTNPVSSKQHVLQQKRSFIEDEGTGSETSEEIPHNEIPETWLPSSWRSYPALQQPVYENTNLLNQQLQIINEMPSIVSVNEIESLQADLKQVETGNAFFIQMGDCAERFAEMNNSFMEKKIKAITAASRIFANMLNKKCIKIGRIAGQFAKPRSQEFEKLPDGTLQYNYRGDNVNSLESRKPDPLRLSQGYFHSVAAMNFIRAQQKHIMHNKLNIQQLLEAKIYPQKQQISADQQQQWIDNQITAIEDINLNNDELYISHEGLLLNYEEAMTKKFNNKFYNTSTHLLWMGERTRQLDGAHVNFFSGIQNPIAVKVGPTTDGKILKQLVNKLNPQNLQGRLIIICRMGNKNISDVLPTLVQAKKEYNLNFIWSCDPMHGNTFSTNQNIKTRSVKDILEELTKFATILHENNENIGGIHLETSPNQVTECLGLEIEDQDLNICYTSACDPRLNISQTLYTTYQFALLLQSLYNKKNTGQTPEQDN
ncbi:hypothetical protein ABPG74_002068 [Tetrahymena malaccensis]